MGWLDNVVGRGARAGDRADPSEQPDRPPTGAEILAAVEATERRIATAAPSTVTARVHRIGTRVAEMVPRLDRMGVASREAHTVVATATSYLPEAVDAYLRLPRDFADTRAVSQGKTSLMLLCDQLDLLAITLGKISDAMSRQDANALIAHGDFLAQKFRSGSLE